MYRQGEKNTVKKVFIAAIFLVIVAAVLIKYQKALAPTATPAGTSVISIIPLEKILVERTDAEKERGLGGRESLASNTGMFFIFDHSDIYPFWMKDMKFPIDIIWLDENLYVVDVEINVPADSYPKIFTPTHKSKYVLEVAAKISEKNHYTTGQQLDFLKPYIYTN